MAEQQRGTSLVQLGTSEMWPVSARLAVGQGGEGGHGLSPAAPPVVLSRLSVQLPCGAMSRERSADR